MKIQIKLNLSHFDRWVDRIIGDVNPTNPGPLQDGMLGSMDVYMESMRVRFASFSGRGGDWAEHAPSTIARRGEGAPILNEGGQLEASLQRNAAGHVLEITGTGVVEGSADRTANFHQHGTEHMPARPILVDPDQITLERMKQPIVESLSATLKDAAA